ncbi:conserved hypothetical protein [Cupriavidus taiwanensis]|uniref:Uncharacterized protein n=2 Tax=Cupriavidus taiwanensis TaxID=164546 RepID=A0A375CQS5_9BURK|nr:conserved hypothetical protein [Cupriavidus taiwanensis]
MRFTRFERYTPIDFNARRQAAFARKQQRERDRYPLFAEHVAGEQHTFDDEMRLRQRNADHFEASQRAFQARVWRKARARFFSLPEAVKAQIRAKWLTWTGPTTATYFSFIVDELSGDQARRVAQADAARAAIRQRLRASMGIQTALEVS